MRLPKKLIFKSHHGGDYFLYGKEGVLYHERQDYALLSLPGLDIFIHDQEALDALREVLREKKEEKLPETLQSISGSTTMVLTDE